MAGVADYPRRSQRGEPVWEIAALYPRQGHWSVDQYLRLDSNQLIEYHDGTLEFLPKPSKIHQRIVMVLLGLLQAWAEERGEVYSAPMPLLTAPGEYREPDADQGGDYAFAHADVVMEVVSEGPENRKSDYEEKRKDYAQAGIPEYWIVDPIEKRVTVLKLEGQTYTEHAVAPFGETLESALLPGFKVDTTNFPAETK